MPSIFRLTELWSWLMENNQGSWTSCAYLTSGKSVLLYSHNGRLQLIIVFSFLMEFHETSVENNQGRIQDFEIGGAWSENIA
jgi:hypothetical protein